MCPLKDRGKTGGHAQCKIKKKSYELHAQEALPGKRRGVAGLIPTN